MPANHVPVMLERVVSLLGPALTEPDAVLVDTTLGLGGHSAEFLRRYPKLRVIGIDRDPGALAVARDRLAGFDARTTLVQAVYDELPRVLAETGLQHVQAVLMDLGVSSLQLDQAGRGFAYSYDAPLDMRMDPSGGPTAADVLNSYPAAQLAHIFRSYGEERFAGRIAAAVVEARQAAPITSSAQLVDLVRRSVPAAARRTGGHPAKRTFQALRIEVNGELAALERAIPAAVKALDVGGRIAVLSYHSLEDRLVKQVLAAGAAPSAPPGLPVVPERYQPRLKLLTRGAELPTEEEIAENRRAAPARLRAAERIREDVE